MKGYVEFWVFSILEFQDLGTWGIRDLKIWRTKVSRIWVFDDFEI